MKNWFEVDKEGLAKLLERKGKEFVLFELLQNAWDEPGVTEVIVNFSHMGRNHASLAVIDNSPSGFGKLTHAYTLFAESAKKSNPEQRGRFNLGEKLVLALCDEMEILSVYGGVRFDEEGRHSLRKTTPKGTVVQCRLRMTKDEVERAIQAAQKLIVPANIVTTLNGEPLEARELYASFEATLPTEIANAEGYLKATARKTNVQLFEPRLGEVATLYEMGIPICETGDKWHYNVMQKVPVTLDRDNVVNPGYLKKLRVLTLNATHDQLTSEDVNMPWAEAAASHDECSPEAITSYMNRRFGEKRVSFDPSDPEANKLAVSQGYTVVHGSMMSGTTWNNARAAEAIKPAGQVTPGPKVWTGEDDPNAPVFKDWIPEDKWTPGMKKVADFAKRVAAKVMHINIDVRFCATAHHLGGASYGPGGPLTFNKFRLGADWFEQGLTVEVVELIIHEFGHEYSDDHLSDKYHEALCRLGAKLYLAEHDSATHAF